LAFHAAIGQTATCFLLPLLRLLPAGPLVGAVRRLGSLASGAA